MLAFLSLAAELDNSVWALATFRCSSDLSSCKRRTSFFTRSPSSKGKARTSPLALDLTSTLKFGSTIMPKILPYEIPSEHGFMIDTELEFKLSEVMLKQK